MPGAKARIRLDGADPINRGLLAWWALDDGAGMVARDLSPYRRRGTLTNFAANGWVATQQGRALTFDGVNDYIDTGGRWINNLPRGTFCIRFRPNAGGGILYYEDGGGFNNFAVWCPSPGTSALEFNIGSNTTRNSTSRTWVAGQWYDLAITWGDAIRVYIDGALDNTIAAAVGTQNAVGDRDQIGRYSFGGGVAGLYTPATVNHVLIYNRMLIPAEVARRNADPWAGTARQPRIVPYRPPAVYTLDPQPVAYEYTPADVALTYTPAPPPPDTGDTHDGFKRRSRRERALAAAERRRRDEMAQEAVALRLSLEAAMGMAAEVVDTAPAEAVEAVQTVAKRAARMVPDLADMAPEPALLAAARNLVEQVHAAVAEAERRRALAEDDEDVLMLLRAL